MKATESRILAIESMWPEIAEIERKIKDASKKGKLSLKLINVSYGALADLEDNDYRIINICLGFGNKVSIISWDI